MKKPIKKVISNVTKEIKFKPKLTEGEMYDRPEMLVLRGMVVPHKVSTFDAIFNATLMYEQMYRDWLENGRKHWNKWDYCPNNTAASPSIIKNACWLCHAAKSEFDGSRGACPVCVVTKVFNHDCYTLSKSIRSYNIKVTTIKWALRHLYYMADILGFDYRKKFKKEVKYNFKTFKPSKPRNDLVSIPPPRRSIG